MKLSMRLETYCGRVYIVYRSRQPIVDMHNRLGSRSKPLVEAGQLVLHVNHAVKDRIR